MLGGGIVHGKRMPHFRQQHQRGSSLIVIAKSFRPKPGKLTHFGTNQLFSGVDLGRFLYTSVAKRSFDEGDLLHLRLKADRHNDQNGVTGLLLYDGQRFAQLVEGPDTGLSIVIDRILSDPRHDTIQTIKVGPASFRCFPGWSLLVRSKQAIGFSEVFVAAVRRAVADVADVEVQAFFIGFAKLG